MSEDEQPYCGAEWIPHATMPDGTAAPILCTREVHGTDSRHHSDDPDAYWRWQDANGNFLPLAGLTP